MDGEERERAMLEAQIARAKEQAGQQTLPEVGLQKKEGEKITLNLFNPPPATTEPSGSVTPEEKVEVKPDGEAAAQNGDAAQKEESKPTITFGTIGTSFKPPVTAAVNPLKRPAGGNIFKAAKSAKTDSETTSSSSKKSGYMSEAERLMKEDQARRMRNGGGGGYAGAGPRREGNGPAPKRFVLQ
jgi:DNA/RNA-binding protein KIN17